MRICVAGGSGMIGSNIVRILSKNPHNEVSVADLKDDVDLREPALCAAAVHGMDRVFHLADRTVGIGYSSKHHGQMMTDSLRISLNLLEAARHALVPEYLYVSSSCVYPEIAEDGHDSWTHESLRPESANDGYGWAKIIAEKQCVYYAKEHGMRIVIVRPANIYGPSYNWKQPVENMHVIPALITKMLRGDKEIVVWGSGEQTRTFQYEIEAAELMIKLMDQGSSGEAYNLGGKEWKIREIVDFARTWTKWEGKVTFDTSKPEGPHRKAQDDSKICNLLGRREQYQSFSEAIDAARKAFA